MPRGPKTTLTVRKVPRQGRSRQLVADVLEAAIRVLRRHGAAGFTTLRVAQEAGVSVGSLYQYFPHKEALLFRLQTEEWTATWGALRAVLFGPGAPEARFRRAVRLFFETEAAEAPLRVALADAQALLRDAPEARVLQAGARADLLAFLSEWRPTLAPSALRQRADFIVLALGAIAERCTEQHLDPRRLRAMADLTAAALSA